MQTRKLLWHRDLLLTENNIITIDIINSISTQDDDDDGTNNFEGETVNDEMTTDCHWKSFDQNQIIRFCCSKTIQRVRSPGRERDAVKLVQLREDFLEVLLEYHWDRADSIEFLSRHLQREKWTERDPRMKAHR